MVLPSLLRVGSGITFGRAGWAALQPNCYPAVIVEAFCSKGIAVMTGLLRSRRGYVRIAR